jgi:DNA-binding MarR family transcriptional regulator
VSGTPVPTADDASLQPLHDPLITTWGLVVEGEARVGQLLAHDLESEFELPVKWFEVLLRLGRTPGQAQPLTELATSVSFSSSGFTRLADRMEAAGLVARRPSPSDRRVTLAVLTEAGARLLDRAAALHVASLQRHVAAHLTAEQLDQLGRIMRTLRDAATRPR